MDSTGAYTIATYSIAACGIFLLLIYLNFRPQLAELAQFLRIPVLKHLAYPLVVRHQRHIGRWSRADILMQMTYLGVNIFCLCFKASSLSSAGLRAANLSLISMGVLYATPHLGFLTNILGLSWITVRRLHLSVGVMALLLLIFHVLTTAISGQAFSLDRPENMWAVIVGMPKHNADCASATNPLTITS